jgi:hypothetical protein
MLDSGLAPDAACRDDAKPAGWHAVDHAGAWREVLGHGLAGHGLRPDDLAAIGRGNPDCIAIEGDAAGFVGFRIQRAQDLAVLVAHKVGAVVALIDDPQPFMGCLQAVRLRTGRLEDSLDFANLASRNRAGREGSHCTRRQRGGYP